MYQLSKLTPIVSQVKMNTYISKKLFVSCSQDLEIFCLPAVPTEHLDGHRQPHFLMSLHSVLKTDFLSVYLWPGKVVRFSRPLNEET